MANSIIYGCHLYIYFVSFTCISIFHTQPEHATNHRDEQSEQTTNDDDGIENESRDVVDNVASHRINKTINKCSAVATSARFCQSCSDSREAHRKSDQTVHCHRCDGRPRRCRRQWKRNIGRCAHRTAAQESAYAEVGIAVSGRQSTFLDDNDDTDENATLSEEDGRHVSVVVQTDAQAVGNATQANAFQSVNGCCVLNQYASQYLCIYFADMNLKVWRSYSASWWSTATQRHARWPPTASMR